MLAEKSQHYQDWDLLLPQIMRTIRAVPHTTTGETANYLMMGREVRLPDNLYQQATRAESLSVDAYAAQLQQRLNQVHELIRSRQLQVRVDGAEEPNLFKEGDWVWLKSKQKGKGMANARKLQPKFIGPFKIIESLPYHTYRVSKDGKSTIEHEGRIKLHVTASEQTQPLPLQPPPPPPKPRRAPCPPALPAPEPPSSISYYVPSGYFPSYSHNLEIESLPNFSPRREEDVQELPAPVQYPAITYPVEDSTTDTVTNQAEEAENSTTDTVTNRPDETEGSSSMVTVQEKHLPLESEKEFPTLEESRPRRSGRKHQLPPRLLDYDLS
jgi:hypothetical protein